MHFEFSFIFHAVVTKETFVLREGPTLVFHMVVQMFFMHVTFITIRTRKFCQIVHRVFFSIMTFKTSDITEVFMTNRAFTMKCTRGLLRLDCQGIDHGDPLLFPLRFSISGEAVHIINPYICEQISV